MKHTYKITLILLTMFLFTQFIGLYVVDHYNQSENELPYGMEVPDEVQESPGSFFPSLIIAFIMAIILLTLLTKFKFAFILKAWFFIVVALALGLTLNAIFPSFLNSVWIFLGIGFIFSFFKIYRRNYLIHNTTELFIYPGIAAVFVAILNIYTVIILLILISLYDMWAVWHSGIMQKMAKYQMDHLKLFSGFFIPYMSKKIKAKIKKLKKSDLKKSKIKVNVAILGGGDVIFPIITAGVILKTWGFFGALSVIIGATFGLSYLFFFAEKKKFYPAMPYITTGIFLGMALYKFISSLI